MSRTVWLVRHAIAEERRAGLRDDARALSDRGRRRMEQVASGLHALGLRPEAIRSSPLRRARETAEILAAALAPGRPVELEPSLAPGGDPAELLAALARDGASGPVVLVGHEPDMGRLASFLLTGSPEAAAVGFKKGGSAAIRMPSLQPGSRGALHCLLTPRQARACRRRAG